MRPSALLGLDDEAVALDFDNAAAMRLQQWQDERDLNLAVASNPFIEKKAQTEYRVEGP